MNRVAIWNGGIVPVELRGKEGSDTRGNTEFNPVFDLGLLSTPWGQVLFVEFKRRGQKPTLAQEREHHRLRGHQVAVHVIDNIDTGKLLIDSYLEPKWLNHENT